MDIDKALEVKGFFYLTSEGGWRKNKLFVANEMIADFPTEEFIDKMSWFADNHFEFVSNPEKTRLFVYNGMVTIDFMMSLELDLPELQKEIKKEIETKIVLN